MLPSRFLTCLPVAGRCATVAAAIWLAAAGAAGAAEPQGDIVELSPEQVKQIGIGQAGYQDFPVEQSAVGSIDFDEDMETQVFPPYQGKVLQILARQGDSVQRTQILFTIDSPDLVQAESNLISADATLTLDNRALARAKDLYRKNGMAQKDYDQAVSDQQTAEGALRAARDGVRIFGKTDAEIDHIVSTRRVDPALTVRSPISGVVIQRNVAPGVFVQPGNTPAPLTIADTSVMWMLANAPENLSPEFKVGQHVSVQVSGYPGRVFTGQLAAVGSVVDPTTRRFTLRTEIADPQHMLRSGMFANFTITTGEPLHSLAVPLNGVVREGDGTESVWTTTDRRHFLRKAVKIGLSSHGYRQILEGLSDGETVVTDGAVFLSNMLQADPT
jgi:cobalt-zinc-cadmium efflux system membrane fusion protein